METLNQYLHLHIGAPCQTYIDGQLSPDKNVITITLIFDAIHQKAEYAREYVIMPVLRPLSDITQAELKECEELSEESPFGTGKRFKYNGEDIQELTRNLRAFEPKVTAFLLKKFDLFGLIDLGLATNKITLDG